MGKGTQIDPALLELEDITDRQRDILKVIHSSTSVRGAARSLNLDHAYVDRVLKIALKKAARKGHAPGHWDDGVAPGYIMGKVTVQRGPDGVERTWERQHPDLQAMEAIRRAAFEAMREDIPRVKSLPAPKDKLSEALCNCYVITDFHFNALSWHEETGANWDIEIAERTLLAWFAQAIAQSPPAATAVFAQLSDLLHSDGLEPLTPASKHVLDVDTRFQKVVRAIIRVLRQCIDMLLAKHGRVHILMADANHDPVSQIWLREWLAVLYENEPRVTVDQEPSPYNAFEFGKVALFFHHGHKRKVTNVSEVFAAKYREMFGRTKYAYAHTGHLHSIDVKENNLMVVEQHRTLTAPDAYAARGGWISGRDAQCISYHRDFGEVSRVKVSYDMLRESVEE